MKSEAGLAQGRPGRMRIGLDCTKVQMRKSN